MPILKKNSKRKDYKLLGASLPPWFHNYVSLYSMANGVSITEIIREPLEKWIQEKYKEVPITKLTKIIANKLCGQWVDKKCQMKDAFVDFKSEIETELKSKGLPKNYIDQILREIKWKEQEK